MIPILFASLALAADPEFAGTVKEVETVEKPSGEASAEVGGSAVSGNSSFYQVTAKLAGGYKWQKNRLSMLADALWGKGFVDTNADGTLADDERVGPRVETARRFAADARYDRFFSERDSLYVLGGALVDPFAGYDLRTHEQLGYSRALVVTEKTNLIAEIGADYAQENFVDGVDPNYADVIALREMVALKHAFNDNLSFEEVVEAFENVLVLEDVRVANTLTISAKLSDKFALKASHALRFDNQPVEGFRPLDQTVLVTLVATLLKTEPPPPVDAPAEVVPADAAPPVEGTPTEGAPADAPPETAPEAAPEVAPETPPTEAPTESAPPPGR